MAGKREPTNIQDYRRKWNMNIGVILFAIILIYVVVTILIYMTGKHITFYQVQEGTVLKDEVYTGIALRTEQVIDAKQDGYLNFYQAEGTKIASGDQICAVSDRKLDFSSKKEKEQTAELTVDEQKTLLSEIRVFTEGYEESAFSDVYSLKDKISSVGEEKTNQSQSAKLLSALKEEKGSYEDYYSPRDGILSYEIDGYENLKPEDVTDNILNKKEYSKKETVNNQKITSGSGVYKLVTSENWTIVMKINSDTAKKLLAQKKTSIDVKFLKDNEIMIAGLSIEEKGKNDYYAYLSFDGAMIRYLSERYLDVELILENATGLRVPKSAVIEKDCYMIPKEYIVENGETEEEGVLIKENSGKTRFQATNIFYQDSNSQKVCVSAEDLPEGTVIQMQDSNNTKTLSDPKKQAGVYEAGSGYAVFTTIDIAEESDEYYITGSDVSNQLSNYDRIVLNADSVEEDEILVQ